MVRITLEDLKTRLEKIKKVRKQEEERSIIENDIAKEEKIINEHRNKRSYIHKIIKLFRKDEY